MRKALGAMLLLTGCATVSWVSGETGCPEDELREVPSGAEGPGLLADVFLRRRAGPREEPPATFTGCGHTWVCYAGACEETPLSRAGSVADAVPELMRRSVLEVAPGGTAERTGFFSWQLQSALGELDSRATTRTDYRCVPGHSGEPVSPALMP